MCAHGPSRGPYTSLKRLPPASKMIGTSFCFCLILASAVVAIPAPEEGRELGYEPYDSPGYPDKWQLSTLGECTGMFKPLVIGLLIGALVKLPLLLLGKLLLLKATAPLAVGAALLPLGLYAVYRSSVQQTNDQSKPTSRLLPEDCLLATACNLGAVAPKSSLPSATWVLKMLEDGLEKRQSATLGVSGYREAYLKGASSKSCTAYTCPYL